MPDTKYERDTQLFTCGGLDLNRPVDSTKPTKLPYLKNARSYQSGRIEPRFGLTNIAEIVSAQSPVHSARRLNDPLNSTYARIVGAGTHLAYGQTSFSDADSGYSGNPLALVPWTPVGAPTPYMYVADSLRMRKISRTGTLDTIGYAAPTSPPDVALTPTPAYKVIDEFDATTGWGQAGTAGAPSLLSAGPGYRTTGTIIRVLYDVGTTGWASINLSSMVGVGYGERLTFNPSGGNEEIATVQTVLPDSVSTTIASIIYDAGVIGLCSIVLATPIEQVSIDSLLRNSSIAENARVIAVTRGPDGTTSIRLSTPSTWAAGNTVQLVASIRVYLVNTHAAGETVRTNGVRSSITVGTGTLTKTAALDLSFFSTGIPIRPDDYIHISMRVDRPDLVTELKVQLDVDSTTNDFTRNFYTRSFRASDLTPSVRNLQPIISTNATIIQREILDSGGGPAISPFAVDNGLPGDLASRAGGVSAFVPRGNPSFIEQSPANVALINRQQLLRDDVTTPSDSPIILSQQLESGDVQWTDLTFRVSDLIRVGTDDTRSLQNVATIRIVAIVTGTVVLDMDSWWVGGGYGPDAGEVTAVPYVYRYRVRNPTTNVPSNFSPAARLAVTPYRQSVTVSPPQYAAPTGTSLAATDLVLDIERFGGEIADWHYAGTIANVAAPVFTDTYPDNVVGGNPVQINDNYQPWPVLGLPVTGTTGIVSGTTLDDSGTDFNLSWAPGTRILVNSQPYTIYRVISTARLETVENMGAQTSVTWRIDEPTILAQPMPCLWEWDGTFFACGDLINPGRLYYSKPNSETTRDRNYIDITSPSEPLMNGVQFNIRSYVFSSDNFIQLLTTGNPEAPYRYEFIPNGKGLFSRWAVTRNPKAPYIAFQARDGIYTTIGGAPESITDDDLFPLFPNEGNLGNATNGVSAPYITSTSAAKLRLEHYDSYLYYDYVDSTGNAYFTLVWSDAIKGWFWDVYTPNIVFHYGEEGAGVHSLLCGAANTHLYQYAGIDDAGTMFSFEFTTPSRDQADPRRNKLYGDIMLDVDTDSLNAVSTPYFNNNATSATPTTVNNSTRTQVPLPFDSAWVTARNISLNVVVQILASGHPLFYIWEPRWTFESAPISAFTWEISPTTFGMENMKHIGICKITHVSPAALSLTFTVDGTAQTPITIPASGAGIYEQTIFRVPVYKGKLYKLRIASESEFRLDPRDSFIDVKPWDYDGEYQRLRVFGDYSMVEG